MVLVEVKGEFEELNALTVAEGKGFAMASNLELDAILQTDAWKEFQDAFPCWSGTLVAYKAPGVPFGETVEFEGLTFKVPKKFQMKTNCVLVCNHPDFKRNGGVFVPGKSLRCIAFPSTDGWYLPDKESGIPSGEKSNSNADRYLWRRGGDYVGLLVRGVGYFFVDDRRYVDAYLRPRYRFGVVLRSGKNKAVKHVHEWHCACGAVRRGSL